MIRCGVILRTCMVFGLLVGEHCLDFWLVGTIRTSGLYALFGLLVGSFYLGVWLFLEIATCKL